MGRSPVVLLFSALAASAAADAATTCAAPGLCEDADATSLLQYKEVARHGSHADWESYEALEGENCYGGNGAEELGGPLGFPTSGLRECQQACDADPSCQAVTMCTGNCGDQRFVKGVTCWKRRNIIIPLCAHGTQYTTWRTLSARKFTFDIMKQGLNPDAFKCQRLLVRKDIGSVWDNDYEYKCQLGKMIMTGHVGGGSTASAVKVQCITGGGKPELCGNLDTHEGPTRWSCGGYTCNPDCSRCVK